MFSSIADLKGLVALAIISYIMSIILILIGFANNFVYDQPDAQAPLLNEINDKKVPNPIWKHGAIAVAILGTIR